MEQLHSLSYGLWIVELYDYLRILVRNWGDGSVLIHKIGIKSGVVNKVFKVFKVKTSST